MTKHDYDTSEYVHLDEAPAPGSAEGCKQWRNLSIHRLTYTPDAAGAKKLAEFLSHVQGELGKAVSHIAALEQKVNHWAQQWSDMRDEADTLRQSLAEREKECGWLSARATGWREDAERFRTALAALLSAYDEERQAIDVSPDAGCIECTVGTVPDDKNTGLCAFHRAQGLMQ